MQEAAKSLFDAYESVNCKDSSAAEQVAGLCEKPEATLLKSMLHLLSLVLEVCIFNIRGLRLVCVFLVFNTWFFLLHYS